MYSLNPIAAYYSTRACKVSKKYRKVLGIGIEFFDDTDTLKMTRYPILRVLGIGFVPSLAFTARTILLQVDFTFFFSFLPLNML